MYRNYPHEQSSVVFSGGGPVTIMNCSFEMSSGGGILIQGTAPPPAPTWEFGTAVATNNNEPECIICLDGPGYCAYCDDDNPGDGEFYEEDDGDTWCECDDSDCEYSHL